VPSLLAEAATLGDQEPFNRVAAMYSRLIDLIGNDTTMSDQNRIQALRLAMAIERDLDAMTCADEGAHQRWRLAREAQLSHLLRFASCPEYVKLLIERLAP